ncbi:hypothetical protein RSSM_04754 [Rhodopirellula sallentina SM41]|uniref:Uncharacterized protein n=1 Tax=Rhodopirellula sallentina SM41 TaxID=1263870 RepID=M5TX73_9BACT|nr:hypothetical protein RSSM_04754 [Rhodopirellula sallentina SM41]
MVLPTAMAADGVDRRAAVQSLHPAGPFHDGKFARRCTGVE